MIFWNYKIEKFKSAYIVFYKSEWYLPSEILYTVDTLSDAVDRVSGHAKVLDNNIRLKIINYVK